MARPLVELRKLTQHQLNSIRKEELIQSILSTQESGEDGNYAIMTQLTALTKEVAQLKEALTSPDSNIKSK